MFHERRKNNIQHVSNKSAYNKFYEEKINMLWPSLKILMLSINSKNYTHIEPPVSVTVMP